MTNLVKKIAAIMMITIFTIAAAAATSAVNDKRITLRNGKAKEQITLNPSRTYKFVINGKEFTKLSINLETKGGQLQVEVRSPSGKMLTGGKGTSFTVKSVEKGDYIIVIKNVGKSDVAAGFMQLGDIKG